MSPLYRSAVYLFFFFSFLVISEFWAFHLWKLVMLCISCPLFYSGLLTGRCLNECMQHENYGRGPPRALASSNTSRSRPNKAALQHLELYDALRKQDTFPLRKELTKGVRFLRAQGVCGARLVPVCRSTLQVGWGRKASCLIPPPVGITALRDAGQWQGHTAEKDQFPVPCYACTVPTAPHCPCLPVLSKGSSRQLGRGFTVLQSLCYLSVYKPVFILM